MAVIDFIPELLTAATAASGVVGVYYERLRKRIERQEPAKIEQVANEAVADVRLEPTVLIPPVPGQQDRLTVSRTELQELLDTAVGTAVTAMKGELAVERKQDRRAALRAGIAFCITGILASAAITLYVHPLT
jgi:hypothetical protein